MGSDKDRPYEPSSHGTKGSALTRRKLLTTLVRTGLAAPVALSSIRLAAQTLSAPQNLRIIGSDEPTSYPTPTSGRAVITPGDLNFLGFIRVPAAAGNLWFSDPALTLRKVNGEPRAFIFGNRTDNSPVLEFALPSSAPNRALASAPFCTLTRNWGAIMAGRTLTGGSGWVPGGLFWDRTRNALWWTYGDSYVPVQSHPTLGCTILNDSNGTYVSYGPWRTEWTSQRTRGALCAIPPAFASAYTSGKPVGVMASQASGNGQSPFGAILSAIGLPDPTTTPADSTSSSHWTIANHGLILHDLSHRQARDTRYKHCGWVTPYNCDLGVVLDQGIALFSGVDPASNENDTMSACVWVDLPDKHGLIYFGQLVTTPEGYSAPGDPNGYVHQWYGDPSHTGGRLFRQCCHGQDDPWWGGTGPGAHYRVPMGWIYNPDDLIATAQGKASLWSRTPRSTFQWKTYVPELESRYPSAMWGGGAVFDPDTRRLYVVMSRHDSITVAPHARPVILVFEIR